MDINKKNMHNNFKQGDVCIGYTDVNGNREKVFFNSSYDPGLVVLGRMGSGKGVCLQNYINDSLKKGDSMVVIDYIKNSDLTSNIKKIVSEDKLVVLDCEDVENLQSLSYNELNYIDDMSENSKMN